MAKYKPIVAFRMLIGTAAVCLILLLFFRVYFQPSEFFPYWTSTELIF